MPERLLSGRFKPPGAATMGAKLPLDHGEDTSALGPPSEFGYAGLGLYGPGKYATLCRQIPVL